MPPLPPGCPAASAFGEPGALPATPTVAATTTANTQMPASIKVRRFIAMPFRVCCSNALELPHRLELSKKRTETTAPIEFDLML
jgi:hypothetical protein